MAIALLVTFIVLEAAFAAVMVRRRGTARSWIKARIFASLAELAIVTVAVLVGQGAPGMRFTAILAVLVLRIGIELAFYLAKRNRPASMEPIRTSRVVRSAIRSSLVAAIALAPAFLFADYDGLPTTVEHEVAQASAILIDLSRTDPYESDGSAREIPAHFYYPADADRPADAGNASADEGEKHPFVVFCPEGNLFHKVVNLIL